MNVHPVASFRIWRSELSWDFVKSSVQFLEGEIRARHQVVYLLSPRLSAKESSFVFVFILFSYRLSKLILLGYAHFLVVVLLFGGSLLFCLSGW